MPGNYAAPIAAIGGIGDARTRASLQALLDSIRRLSTDLSGAAFTGDYNDLVNKPTIPSAIFSTIAVSGQSNVVGDSATDTLTLVAGAGITLATNPASDSITISAAGGISSGTAFPASPAADDLFYRTDHRLLFFYDGTRWLTTELFSVGFAPFLGAQPLSATQNAAMTAMPFAGNAFDVWLEEFIWSTNVQTANNATNYWTLTLYDQRASTIPAIVSATTQADAVGAWVQHRTTINALLGTASKLLDVGAAKTGAPGVLYYGASVTGRLVGV